MEQITKQPLHEVQDRKSNPRDEKSEIKQKSSVLPKNKHDTTTVPVIKTQEQVTAKVQDCKEQEAADKNENLESGGGHNKRPKKKVRLREQQRTERNRQKLEKQQQKKAKQPQQLQQQQQPNKQPDKQPDKQPNKHPEKQPEKKSQKKSEKKPVKQPEKQQQKQKVNPTTSSKKPKAKVLHETSLTPQPSSKLTSTAAPVREQKSSTETKSKTQAEQSRIQLVKTKEETTLRASQATTIKAILGANASINTSLPVTDTARLGTETVIDTLQPPQTEQASTEPTPASAPRSQLLQTPHHQPPSSPQALTWSAFLPSQNRTPRTSLARRRGRNSSTKAMASERTVHGDQIPYPAVLPPVTSEEFMKKANEHFKSIGNKYGRPSNPKPSTSGKVTVPSSSAKTNSQLQKTSKPPAQSAGHNRTIRVNTFVTTAEGFESPNQQPQANNGDSNTLSPHAKFGHNSPEKDAQAEEACKDSKTLSEAPPAKASCNSPKKDAPAEKASKDPKTLSEAPHAQDSCNSREKDAQVEEASKDPKTLSKAPHAKVGCSSPKKDAQAEEAFKNAKTLSETPHGEISHNSPEKDLQAEEASKNAKILSEAQLKQRSSQDIQKKTEAVARLPSVREQLLEMLPVEYRHIPQPFLFKAGHEVETQEVPTANKTVSDQPQESHSNVKRTQKTASGSIRHEPKVQTEDPAKNENQNDTSLENETVQPVSKASGKGSRASGASEHETLVPEQLGTAKAAPEDDGVPPVWQARATPAQEEKIWRVIERLFEMTKSKFPGVENAGFLSEVFEADDSFPSRELEALPGICYPEHDSRAYEDAEEWMSFTRQEKPTGNRSPREVLEPVTEWLDRSAEISLHRPFRVDMTVEEFKNGSGPVSGVRQPYTFYPPDTLFVGETPHFGSYDWSLVPTIPLPKLGAILIPENATEVIRVATSHKAFVDRAYKANREQQRRMDKEQAAKDIKYHRNRAQLDNNPFVPKANIYIRPAKALDIPQLTKLYNRYVENTIDAIECQPIVEKEMRTRFLVAKQERRAFLVAISLPPGGKTPPHEEEPRKSGRANNGRRNRNNRGNTQVIPPEVVVGFSYIERFSLPTTAFEHTAELFVFVSPDHLRLGIGKTLVDRIMPSVDTLQSTHSGTDFVPGDRSAQMMYELGGPRKTKKIVATLFYHTGEEEDFRWKKNWLEKKLFFTQASFMYTIAEKFGKPYHMAQFVRETMNGGTSGHSTWYPDHDLAVPNIISHI